VAVQSLQVTPFNPQAESSRPMLQLPDVSQQPPQMAGHPPPPSSPPPSSPSVAVVASSEASSSPVDVLPELLAPVPPLMSLLLELPELLDPPDEVFGAPESFFGVTVVGVVKSSETSVDPAAHAMKVAKARATPV
jgi:hypothetical protein